jgi:hypothetical protein
MLDRIGIPKHRRSFDVWKHISHDLKPLHRKLDLLENTPVTLPPGRAKLAM